MHTAQDIAEHAHQDIRVQCPRCGPDRKKKNEKTLSITVKPDSTLWYCHHCGDSGAVKKKSFYEDYMDQPAQANVAPIPTQLNQDVDTIRQFFASRGVTISDLNRLPRMTVGTRYFNGELKQAIGFVYGTYEQPTAIKWRAIDTKAFTAEGAAKTFYNIENIDPMSDELLIVEGECDVIALAQLGIEAVSCPNGAPIKVSNRMVDPDEDKKFAFVWDARDIIKSKKKIILAVDNDEPGEALAEEISRRVGRAKCWRVKFPDGIKDANEAVQKLGRDRTLDIIRHPEPVPLSGVYAAKDYAKALTEIYEKGHGQGVSTGLSSLDNLFTVVEGQLSVVTGVPSSGKSEFVDQIMVNLAMKSGWKFAVCSFENPPHMHIAKLMEKVAGKPFYQGYGTRMDEDERDAALSFIDEHFVFLESRDGNMATIESIIDRAKQAVMRLGVRGLVIDPYNYIAGTNDDEHLGISQMLSQVTLFAQSHGVHVWFVAHPTKLRMRDDGTYPVPKGNEISGSAAWFAKADLGITVQRTDDGPEIHCWKCRWKWVGQQGSTVLRYDIPTGRYSDWSKPETPFADRYANSKIPEVPY